MRDWETANQTVGANGNGKLCFSFCCQSCLRISFCAFSFFKFAVCIVRVEFVSASPSITPFSHATAKLDLFDSLYTIYLICSERASKLLPCLWVLSLSGYFAFSPSFIFTAKVPGNEPMFCQLYCLQFSWVGRCVCVSMNIAHFHSPALSRIAICTSAMSFHKIFRCQMWTHK